MRVLVTGATGFLGSSLVERLANEGTSSEVRCLVRPSSDVSQLLRFRDRLNLTIFRQSLTSRGSLHPAVEGIDIVFHLAAAMRGAAADMFFHTVVGTRNLLEALPLTDTPRIILASSFSVYGTPLLRRNQIVDETTPLEAHPEKRDPYAYVKWRQEKLVQDFQGRVGFELVIMRPGMIYGPRGTPMSTRVGILLGRLFLHLGGNNLLPITYVDNCADAFLAAAFHPDAAGHAFNVVDDELLTASEYLRAYQRHATNFRSYRIPFFATILLSRALEKYHISSKGQLPAALTPYKSLALWKGQRFSNSRLRSIGWRQNVSTEEGVRRTFAE